MVNALPLLVERPRLIAAILVSGIGGSFQFGFQISALTSPSSFIKELVNRTCMQRYDVSLEPWEISLIWSLIVSVYCIGGLIGLRVLENWLLPMEGIALIAHSMYLTECAPLRLRGMVAVTVSTFIAFGKFFGQLLGLSELLGAEERWPWLLAFNGFTAAIQLMALPFFPESPCYLLLDRGDRQGCEKAMDWLWGRKSHSVEIEDMLKEHAALKGQRSLSVLEFLQKKSERWHLLTILATFVGIQLCGINAVYLYSMDVFLSAGIHPDKVRYATLGTGLCEVTTSLACAAVIENTGKLVLFLRGYMAMSVILGLLTVTLNLQEHFDWMPYCSMVLIFAFIFFFSTGPAGVTAALPAEIFMQSSKAAAFTFAGYINWTGKFLIGMFFPLVVQGMGPYSFLIFLVVCFFTGIFVWMNVPETKNRTPLEIAEEFQRMHTKQQKHELGKQKDVTLRTVLSTKL